jgi:lambda family phage portal protein
MGIVAHDDFADVLGPADGQTSTPAPDGFRVPNGAGTEHAIVGDPYEGASRQSRDMAMWRPSNQPADRDILPNKRLSDARVRDTLRNDAFVRNGQLLHQDNIVGGLFFLNSKPQTKILLGKEDEVWEREFQEEVESKFTLWGESISAWPDASRRHTFSSLVRLAVGTFLATGEVLAAVEWSRDEAEIRPMNTSIRMIDLDRLSTPTLNYRDPYIIGGVEVNKRHVPIAYHIRKAHPDAYYMGEAYEWERIDAKKPWGRPQVIHLFDQQRANQTRGMADFTVALKEARMTKTFRETVLQNAVVNATYAASIESDLDTESIFTRLGGGSLGQDVTEEYKNMITGYMGGYLGAVAKYMGASNQFQIGGVKIPHLPPGSKLNLQPAAKGGPLGTDLEKSLLRHIAAALGVSYEQLSKDFSETNYSSARAAMTETWKRMVALKALIADRFATIIYRLWLEEALNSNLITALPRKLSRDTAWLYQPFAMEAVTACEWIGASRGQIDELKETQAAVLRMKYGLSTMERESARLGADWRQTIKQMAREKQALEDAEFQHPASASDNMMNAATGEPADPSNGTGSGNAAEFADILGE